MTGGWSTEVAVMAEPRQQCWDGRCKCCETRGINLQVVLQLLGQLIDLIITASTEQLEEQGLILAAEQLHKELYLQHRIIGHASGSHVQSHVYAS